MAASDRDEKLLLEYDGDGVDNKTVAGDSVDNDKVAYKQKLPTAEQPEESSDNTSDPNKLSLSPSENKEVRAIDGTLAAECVEQSTIETEESNNENISAVDIQASCTTKQQGGHARDTDEATDSASDNSEHSSSDVCLPCSQEDKQQQATFFCVECGENLCADCLRDHNKFTKMRSHRVLEKGANTPKVHARQPPVQKCMYHDGRVLDRYCHSHEAVCCAVCSSRKHSACRTKSLQDAVASIQVDQDITPVQDALKSILGEYQHMKKLKQDDIRDVQATLKDTKDKIEEFKNKLISRIESLNNKAKKDVTKKAMLCEEEINKDIQQINSITTTIEMMLQQLQAYKYLQETELFIHVKSAKQIFRDETDHIKQYAQSLGQKGIIQYVPNKGIEQFLMNCKSFGKITDIIYKKQMHINLLNRNSERVFSMTDQPMLLIDKSSSCLTKLNASYKESASCPLQNCPVGVCEVKPGLAAVLIDGDEKQVQFVEIGETLTPTTSFSLEGGTSTATDIASCDGNLMVSRMPVANSSTFAYTAYRELPGCIQQYDINGSLLRTFEKDLFGRKMFQSPKCIAVNEHLSKIYIADERNGLVILSTNGQKLYSGTDQELASCSSVCIGPDDQIIVSERPRSYYHRSSCKLFHLDQWGQKISQTDLGQLSSYSYTTSEFQYVSGPSHLIDTSRGSLDVYEVQIK